MEHNKIEFGISKINLEGCRAIIEGRCHYGPIVCGSTFTEISAITVEMTKKMAGPATLHHLAQIEIKVDSIWAYGHQLKELSSGMTARIEISGTGFEHLKAGLVLS
jgi:hypothetical protein